MEMTIYNNHHIITLVDDKEAKRNSKSHKIYNYRTLKYPDVATTMPIDLDDNVHLGFDEDKKPFAIFDEELPQKSIPNFVGNWMNWAKHFNLTLTEALSLNLLSPEIKQWAFSSDESWNRFVHCWTFGWVGLE